MARREDIDNAIWDDEDFDALSSDAALLYLWSFTNPRCGMAGIYKVKRRHLCEGRFDDGRLDDALAELEAAGFAFYEDGVLWVRSRIKHLRTKGEPMKRSIKKDIDALPDGHPLTRRLVAEYSESWIASVLPEGFGGGSEGGPKGFGGGSEGVPENRIPKPNLGTPRGPLEGSEGQGQGKGLGLGFGSKENPNLEANRAPAEALRLLGEIAEIRSLAFPPDRRVVKAIADHPDSDPIRAARDARDWACEGAGRTADVRDVVDLFRRQLGFASSRKGGSTRYSAAKRAEELLARGAAIEAEATEIA